MGQEFGGISNKIKSQKKNHVSSLKIKDYHIKQYFFLFITREKLRTENT